MPIDVLCDAMLRCAMLFDATMHMVLRRTMTTTMSKMTAKMTAMMTMMTTMLMAIMMTTAVMMSTMMTIMVMVVAVTTSCFVCLFARLLVCGVVRWLAKCKPLEQTRSVADPIAVAIQQLFHPLLKSPTKAFNVQGVVDLLDYRL